jgi:hypothetical protein
MSTDPHPLAPHVDSAWQNAFVAELRLRDVPGRAIGDALAEVEAHCADSGQDAGTAFGEPMAYAAQRAEQLPTDRHPVRETATVLAQTAGAMGVVWSVPPWLNGEPLVMSGGAVASAVLALAAAVALALVGTPVLRWLLRARWWHVTLVGAPVGAVLWVVMAAAPDGEVRVPAAPVALLSLTLVALGVTALVRASATDDLRLPGERGPRPRSARRRSLAVTLAMALALPVLALLVALVLAFLVR